MNGLDKLCSDPDIEQKVNEAIFTKFVQVADRVTADNDEKGRDWRHQRLRCCKRHRDMCSGKKLHGYWLHGCGWQCECGLVSAMHGDGLLRKPQGDASHAHQGCPCASEVHQLGNLAASG